MPAVSTGHQALDAALINAGWPTQSLIEICQGRGNAEWQLLAPLVTQTRSGHIVLINPPTRPFAPALIHLGVDLNRLIVVEAAKPADWMMAVLQVVQTEACEVVIAWQPKQTLSYTQLRKCQLAAMGSRGLTFVFRPDTVLQQASPAALRVHLSLEKSYLTATVVKQRGMLATSSSEIQLPVPKTWCGGFLYQRLNWPVDQPLKPLRTQPRHLRSV